MLCPCIVRSASFSPLPLMNELVDFVWYADSVLTEKIPEEPLSTGISVL